MRVLVTGGCGFIGSHLVRLLLDRDDVEGVVNLDLLTYAGNPANLADVADDPRYRFVQGDIADAEVVAEAMRGCTHACNLAAESHVDRSIEGGDSFIRTNVLGSYVVAMGAVRAGLERLVQVSTDEVYGSTDGRPFRETDPLEPSSPYSAAKAGGDLQALAVMRTHDLPVVVTHGSNTYGPNQYPEKLVPLFVTNALQGEPLPMYGDGRQVRDWLHARDHARGILHVLEHGLPGESYNIGGGNERENRWITEQILELTGAPADLVRHVEDRAGHDRRYALDSTKAHELGWSPEVDLDEGLAETVAWYRDRRDWWEPIRSGEFRAWYERQYRERLAGATGAS